MTIVVTGATGYIGERVVIQGISYGCIMLAASRTSPTNRAINWLHFDMADGGIIELPSGVSAVIHLAANTTIVNISEADNEVAVAQALMTAANQQFAKYIFVSSQAARPDAPTLYGRTKWRIEKNVLSAGGWVVRPGLVYGGSARGLFGELIKTVNKLPILPAFLPAPMVQPIHVDDVAASLLELAYRNDIPPGVVCVASPDPVTFTTFLHALSRDRLRVVKVFFPVPVIVSLLNIKWIQKEHGGISTAAVRLRSLFDLPLMDTRLDMKAVGIQPRMLTSGMHKSGNSRRRNLLREACALHIYITRERPSSIVMRRYTRAIELLRGGNSLLLPELFIIWPSLIASIDMGFQYEPEWGGEFQWRLNAATLMAEATPSGTRRFVVGIGTQGPIINLLRMARALATEMAWRVAILLLKPVMRMTLRQSLNRQQ